MLDKIILLLQKSELQKLQQIKESLQIPQFNLLLIDSFSNIPTDQNLRIMLFSFLLDYLHTDANLTIFAINHEQTILQCFQTATSSNYPESFRFLYQTTSRRKKLMLKLLQNSQQQHIPCFIEIAFKAGFDFCEYLDFSDTAVLISALKYGNVPRGMKNGIRFNLLSEEELVCLSAYSYGAEQISQLLGMLQSVSAETAALVARNLVFHNGPTQCLQAYPELIVGLIKALCQSFRDLGSQAQENFADLFSSILSYIQVQQQVGCDISEYMLQLLEIAQNFFGFLLENLEQLSLLPGIVTMVGMIIEVLKIDVLQLLDYYCKSVSSAVLLIHPEQMTLGSDQIDQLFLFLLTLTQKSSSIDQVLSLLEIIESLSFCGEDGEEVRFNIDEVTSQFLTGIMLSTVQYMHVNGQRYFDSSPYTRIQQIICKVISDSMVQLQIDHQLICYLIPEAFTTFNIQPPTNFQNLNFLLSNKLVDEFLNQFYMDPLSLDEMDTFLPILLSENVCLLCSLQSHSYSEKTIQFLVYIAQQLLAYPNLQFMELIDNIAGYDVQLLEPFLTNQQFILSLLSTIEISRHSRNIFKQLVQWRPDIFQNVLVNMARIVFFGNPLIRLLTEIETADLVEKCQLQQYIFQGISTFVTGSKDEMIFELRMIRQM